MIELSHAYKTFPGPVHALRNVDLSIQKGEFVFLTGPSGAGKTTLFKILCGFDEVTSGKVQVAGFELDKINKAEKPFFRRRIGVVFQDFKLISDQTTLENVILPLVIQGESKKSAIEKAEALLIKVGLIDRRNQLPDVLSGGEQQRIAIARALIHQPPIIMADEPTGNLDAERAEEIMDLLEDCTNKGMTIFVITHDLELVRRRKKRIIAIKSGEIVKDGRA
jgi:cell division transport system ATP-binding protein